MVAQCEVLPAHVRTLERMPVVIVKGDGAIAGISGPLCKIHGTFVAFMDPGPQAPMLMWLL